MLEASGNLAYRQGNYVMIPPYKGAPLLKEVNIELGISSDHQLYDLSKDPFQRHNLASSSTDILQKLIKDMQKAVGDSYQSTGKGVELK